MENLYGPTYGQVKPDAGRDERNKRTTDWLGASLVNEMPEPSAPTYQEAVDKKYDGGLANTAKAYARNILAMLDGGTRVTCGLRDRTLVDAIKKELGPDISAKIAFDYMDPPPLPMIVKKAL